MAFIRMIIDKKDDERCRPKHPNVTLSKTGKLTFNRYFVERYKTDFFTHCTPFYDKEMKLLRMDLYNGPGGHGVVRLKVHKKVRVSTYCYISMLKTLEKNGVTLPKEVISLKFNWDNAGAHDVLILHLPNDTEREELEA